MSSTTNIEYVKRGQRDWQIAVDGQVQDLWFCTKGDARRFVETGKLDAHMAETAKPEEPTAAPEEPTAAASPSTLYRSMSGTIHRTKGCGITSRTRYSHTAIVATPELLADTEQHCKRCMPSVAAVQTCEWFALCENPATGTTEHPVLGAVPTCDRCASLANPETATPTAPAGTPLEAIEPLDAAIGDRLWARDPETGELVWLGRVDAKPLAADKHGILRLSLSSVEHMRGVVDASRSWHEDVSVLREGNTKRFEIVDEETGGIHATTNNIGRALGFMDELAETGRTAIVRDAIDGNGGYLHRKVGVLPVRTYDVRDGALVIAPAKPRRKPRAAAHVTTEMVDALGTGCRFHGDGHSVNIGPATLAEELAVLAKMTDAELLAAAKRARAAARDEMASTTGEER